MSVKLTYSEEALGHLDKLTDFLIRQAGGARPAGYMGPAEPRP